MFDQSDLIHAYSRSQAIEDGVLIDATATAREAGIRYPVALTAAVWERCVEVPPGLLLGLSGYLRSFRLWGGGPGGPAAAIFKGTAARRWSVGGRRTTQPPTWLLASCPRSPPRVRLAARWGDGKGERPPMPRRKKETAEPQVRWPLPARLS
jgi:hypothetical protein